MSTHKKVLILHTSVGLGHKSIAENIGFYLSKAGYEVKISDIGKVQHGKFEKWVTMVHQFVNRKLPALWGWLYDYGHYIILPFRVFIAGFNYRLTKQLVDEFQPNLIICTQTTSSAVVAYLKKRGWYNGLFAIAFSDYHLHPYWLYDQADYYFANTQEQKEEMIKRGISPDKVIVCGITLKPQVAVNSSTIKQQLGISNHEKVILIGTGSLGLGFKIEDLKQLTTVSNCKTIFVCGKNQALLEQVKKLKLPNIILLGFYEPMDELYSIADLFISKPGGLSVAEAIRWQLPTVITFTLPGQERKNLNYLLEHDLVLARPHDLVWTVNQELHDKKFKQKLGQNPFAGQIIGNGEGMVISVSRALA